MATTCGSTDDALLTPALPSHLPDSAFLISSPPTNPGQSRWDHSLSRKHNVESAVEQCEVVVPSQGQRDDSTVRPQCHLNCLHKSCSWQDFSRSCSWQKLHLGYFWIGPKRSNPKISTHAFLPEADSLAVSYSVDRHTLLDISFSQNMKINVSWSM